MTNINSYQITGNDIYLIAEGWALMSNYQKNNFSLFGSA